MSILIIVSNQPKKYTYGPLHSTVVEGVTKLFALALAKNLAINKKSTILVQSL